jgi:hypothetical protein
MNDVLFIPASSSAPTTVLEVRAYNSCGWSEWTYVGHVSTGQRSLGSNVYPNPVSDILHVDIQTSAATQNRSVAPQQPAATYDIRLYNGQGVIVRQATSKAGNLEINVSNLPNGFYYLHIYDGLNDKPEVQQIIVRH